MQKEGKVDALETRTEEYKGYEVKVEIFVDYDGGYGQLEELGKYTSDCPVEYYVDRRKGQLLGKALPEPDEWDYEGKDGEIDYDTYDQDYAEWEENPNEILSDDLHTWNSSREYRYFLPYCSGETPDEIGVEEWAKYAKQDSDRVERYNRGDWHYIGIAVTLDMGICPACSQRQEIVHSLWGIESDCEDYQEEIIRELAAECLAEAGFEVD